jgi:hypothetical protein
MPEKPETPYSSENHYECSIHRFPTNSRRLPAVIGFLVLMLGGKGAESATSWANACGDGRVDTILDDFDSPWVFCCTAHPSIPKPVLRTVPGCHGNAMAMDYDLTNLAPPGDTNAGQSWLVLQKFFSSGRNLSNYTHIRLAVRASNLNSHDNIEIKLKDASNLYVTSLGSMTDLPVWRPIYIDLREFAGSGTIDLTNIVSMEIAIVRCASCEVFDNPSVGQPEEHTGTLYLDELAAVDLKPGGVHRIVETGFEGLTPNPSVRASAANALLSRITTTGPGSDLIPAWFPEANPNFNTYVQAEALLVFVYEYERTGNVAFRDRAANMATRLLSLQIPPDRTQSGAWFTGYTLQGAALRPPDREITQTSPAVCDGNETMVRDPVTGQLVANNIDRCEWVGNVGWMLIALGKLQRSGFYQNAAALNDALDRGAAWLAGQSQYRGMTAYPNLISLGIEGNISAYFGLLAAGRRNEAALLGNAILKSGWDSKERRMKPGVGGGDFATAIDVSGSWGVIFLWSMGRVQEALDSQGYAASTMRVCSFDDSICGYGDIAGPYTPSLEFTAQAASAGIKDAEFVMQQIYSLQMPSNGLYPGAFPGAADHWYGGPLAPWDTTMAGVSPTAWVYFASYHDPLLDLIGVNTVPFTIGPRGGFSMLSGGSSETVTAGYGRIQPASGFNNPSGLAIFGFRVNNVLASEAAVPASGALTSGRIYAEVGGTVNTGLAIANPNPQPVTVDFYFTDANGTDFGQGRTTIAENSQIAMFLNQAPFNAPSVSGTFTFTSSAPVAVVALRGLTNERSEFLITTLPVADLSVAPAPDDLVFSHFADGGGWTTQVVLVNTSDRTITGSLQFLSPEGQAAALTIDRQKADSFPYSIPARSARVLKTSGDDATVQAGSVRLIPAPNNNAPVGLVVFSFRKEGVTVSEAGVPALRIGTVFRLFAESFGNFNAQELGSGQTGVAVANTSANPAAVNFELMTLSGISTGVTGAFTVPGNGQRAMFISQIQGLTGLPTPFQGIVRISTASLPGISVIGLRGRYNERADFLITTTQPTLENVPATNAELFLAHFVNGGGYTTQFVMFNGSNDQSHSGMLRLFDQSGLPLNLSLQNRR